MLTNILLFIILSTLIQRGWLLATGPDYILHPVWKWIQKKTLERLHKPLRNCSFCMGGIWSVFVWIWLMFATGGAAIELIPPQLLLVIIPAQVGANLMLAPLMKSVREYIN